MDSLLKELEQKSRHILGSLREELGGIRTNRPTPQLVEDIQVEYAEQKLRVKQLGTISMNPPREIVISLWDKDSVPAVAKALQESSLKFNPTIDGTFLRVNLPPLTAERREELTKVIKQISEQSRIQLRALRDHANKAIETEFKAKTVSEDQKFKTKKKVQDGIDKANKEIEGMVEKKVKEVSE